MSAPHAFVPEARAPLDSLRSLIAETQLDVPADMPPMAGGLVGYLGYDMVRQMERLAPASPTGFSGAMLHHWRGTAFVPGAKAADRHADFRQLGVLVNFRSPALE